MKETCLDFVAITVPADGLALFDARPSAGPVMTKFECHVVI